MSRTHKPTDYYTRGHPHASGNNMLCYTLADLSVPSETSATSGGVIGVLLFVIFTLVMTIAILGVYIKTRGKENTDIRIPWGINY